MPDATGLELIAQAVRAELGDEAVVGTSFYRGAGARLEVAPARVHDVIAYLREAKEPWDKLMSVHGCDYLPEEPRLGIHYELLSMERVDRLRVKTRVGVDDPHVRSVVDLFAGANFHEREVYDMFGVRLRRPPRHAPAAHAGGLRGLSAAPRLPAGRRARDVHVQRGQVPALV